MALPQIKGDRLYASVEGLKTTMDMAGKYGISVDCTVPPFLKSSFIDTEKHSTIMLDPTVRSVTATLKPWKSAYHGLNLCQEAIPEDFQWPDS